MQDVGRENFILSFWRNDLVFLCEEEEAIGVKLVREALCNLYLREKVIDLSQFLD